MRFLSHIGANRCCSCWLDSQSVLCAVCCLLFAMSVFRPVNCVTSKAARKNHEIALIRYGLFRSEAVRVHDTRSVPNCLSSWITFGNCCIHSHFVRRTRSLSLGSHVSVDGNIRLMPYSTVYIFGIAIQANRPVVHLGALQFMNHFLHSTLPSVWICV